MWRSGVGGQLARCGGGAQVGASSVHVAARTLLVLLAGLFLLPLSARAALSGGAGVGTVSAYSGIVLRRDGVIEALPVRCNYSITNTGAATTRTYKVSFSLLDATDTSVGGATTAAFSVTIAAAGGGEYPVVAGARSAALSPTSLTAGAPYRLRTQLYLQNPVDLNYAPIGAAALSSEYRWRVVDAGSSAGVVGWLNTVSVLRSYAIASIPGREAFQVQVQGILGRLDELALPEAAADYRLHFDSTLTGAASGPVALVNPRTTALVVLANHAADGAPASVAIAQALDLRPLAQIDSLDTFTLTVALSFAGPDGVESPAHSTTLAAARLLHFNGILRFGPAATRLNEVSNTPAPLGPALGGGENTRLGLPLNGASLGSDHTLSAPAGLAVVLYTDGTAETWDMATVTPPAVPDIGVIRGVRFTRENITLGPAGASATLRVRFPVGFGLTTSASIRRLRADFPLGIAPLDGALLPSGSFWLRPVDIGAVAFFAAHEQLPTSFESTSIVWNTALGSFALRRDNTHYVRAHELDTLDALRADLVDPTAADRPSNEAVFRHPAASTRVDLVISADAQGRAVLTTVRLDLLPAAFTAHFPRGVTVAWGQIGALVFQDGEIDPAQSTLPGATEAVFACSPNCRHSPVSAPDSQFTFTPNARTWSFSPDGGLQAEGTLAAAPLRWGTRDLTHFVHTTGNFTSAAARLPGNCLRSALASSAADDRPGELLLSGQGRPGEPAYAEHPGSAGYAAGLADYAGLNFRVDGDGAQTATTVLGKLSAPRTLGPYDLRGTCKYYARPAGVSGIHEAVTASFAACTGGLNMYGFPMTLDNLQVSYLDNQNQESLVSGTVSVPGVRETEGFRQPFTRIELLCNGDLGDLTLPNPNNLEHTLHYWHATFHATTAEFIHQPPPDTPTSVALVFGADVSVRGVLKAPVSGALGFFPSGNLVTAADGFTGVDSRLRLPSSVGLDGPRSTFAVHPISRLYFNNALDPDAPAAAGFVSFAGTVDVPFFEDMKVHVLARTTGGGAQTVIRGGWPDGGWTEGGQTFFTSTTFDPMNRGFPSAGAGEPAGLGGYLEKSKYTPRVHQDWLGFVTFNMPVMWDAARRQFISDGPTEEDFLIVSTQRVIQALTPSGADLRFGMQFKGLPRVNLAALVIDEEEATNELIQHIPGGADIAGAAKALEALLNGRSDALVNGAVDAAVDGFLDGLFNAFDTPNVLPNRSAAAASFYVDANRPALADDLQLDLKGSVAARKGTTIISDISEALDKLEAGLQAADYLLRKQGNGPYQVDGPGARLAFLTTTTDIGGDAIQGVQGDINRLINVDLRPTLDDIHRAVVKLHAAVRLAQDQLEGVRDEAEFALEQVNGAKKAVGVADLAIGDIQQYFDRVNDPLRHFLDETGRTALRTDLKRLVRDRIHASTFVSSLQKTLKDLLEPLRDDYQTTFERMHGVINDVLRSAFTKLVAEPLANELGSDAATANKAIGDFNDTFELAKIDGTARIEGDSLVAAHLSAELGLRVPDRIGIKGWIDYRQHKSEPLTPTYAAEDADGRIEIEVGAEAGADIKGNPPVHAKLVGRYAMRAIDGMPLAVGGSLDFDTNLKFEDMSLKRVHFQFAFGDRDNYVYAEGEGSFWFIDANVRAFLGQTTDAALLRRVDPLLQDVLAVVDFRPVTRDNPITGVYWNGDGDGSLNRFFGLPDSDFLRITGKGGEGHFMFFNKALIKDLGGNLPRDAKLLIGMRSRKGLSVTLALATAAAELRVLGVINALDLRKTADFADLQETISKGGLFDVALAGDFTPSFGVKIAGVKVEVKKTFKFSAAGKYTPPPLVPPPGFVWVNKLDFDPDLW